MNLTDPDIPEHFQVVHLDLAPEHEPEHEAGDGATIDRYTLLLPLDPEGRILEAEALRHPHYCRVSHLDPVSGVLRGLMRPGPGRDWRFDFGETEEAGFRFGEERFAPGRYVVVLRGQAHHSYKVVALQPL